MGEATISIDYGTYTNITYKKTTDVEMSWEAPKGLEAEYEKQFDDYVAAGIKKLEKTLSSGVNKAKEWLADTDKKIDEIFARYNKDRKISSKDVDFIIDIQPMLPDIVENLEKQRVKIFDSMLEGILSDAVDALVKKFKLDAIKEKAKRWVEFTAFAVLALTAAAVGLAAAIVSYGTAAPLVLGLVGAALGGAGTVLSVSMKFKQMVSGAKGDAKSLESAAKNYAEAYSAFSDVLDRQSSQLAAKKAQLANLGKQIDANAANMDKLEAMSKKADMGTKAAAKLEEAKKAQDVMMTNYENSQKSIAEQEKLLKAAQDKKDFATAKKYADSLSDTEDFIDKINDQGSNLNTILGVVTTLLSSFS